MADLDASIEAPPKDGADARHRLRHRLGLTAGIGGLALLLIATLAWLLATSPSPWVASRPAPTAEQVGAGRSLLNKLLRAHGSGAPLSDVTFDPAELDGFGALAGDMFKPDRAFARIANGGIEVTGSHRLIGGRWLNVVIRSEASSAGFPPTHLRVGAFSFGPVLSRWLIQAGRQVARLRGVKLPPIDDAIRRVTITPDLVTVRFALPGGSGVVNELAGTRSHPVDSAAVTRLYCRLAAEQTARPSSDFAEQVRRVFSYVQPDRDPVDQNRAAFVALSMFAVATQTADLTESARADSRRCRVPIPVVYLQGRPDSPKHWALSAALAAVLGSEPARAAGEWKELSDSLPRGAGLDADDGSGFSFVDIAADRAGFLTALAAVRPDTARSMTDRLASASQQRLLPRALLKEPEGLDPGAFRQRYGGIDKQGYSGVIAAMDRTLRSEGLVPPR